MLLSVFSRHDKYAHPDIVLNSNATLMGIDKKFAMFAICDKDIDVHSHTAGPFFYISQFKHCTHVIRMPLVFFSHLAEKLEDPPQETKFILLSNTGRCGSTLLTQLYEEMSNTVAISEPEVLMEFSHSSTFDGYPKAQRDLLLRSCIRLLFKSANQSVQNKRSNKVIDCFLIKPKAHGILVAQELNGIYPNIKHLWMYRHPAEYVRSVRSVFKSLLHPVVHHMMMYMAFKMEMKDFILRQMPQYDKDEELDIYTRRITNALEKLDVDHDLEQRFAALFCCNLISLMRMAAEEGIDFHVVSYHELKVSTHSDMNKIRQFCKMEQPERPNEDEVDSLVTQLPKNDSQTNSGLSRNNLQRYQTALKDTEISTVDEVLELCGFPSCDKFPLDAENLSHILGTKKHHQQLDVGDETADCGQSTSYTQKAKHKSAILKHSSEPHLTIDGDELPAVHTLPRGTGSGAKVSSGQKYPRSISLEMKANGDNTKPSLLVTNKSLWLPVNRFF